MWTATFKLETRLDGLLEARDGHSKLRRKVEQKEKYAMWQHGALGNRYQDRSCVQIACNTDLVVFRDESRWFEGALANFWMRALAS